MNVGRYLQSAFSPHGLAVLDLLLCLALGLIALVGFINGHVAGAIILLLALLVVHVVLERLSRCPDCGKSPMEQEAEAWAGSLFT